MRVKDFDGLDGYDLIMCVFILFVVLFCFNLVCHNFGLFFFVSFGHLPRIWIYLITKFRCYFIIWCSADGYSSSSLDR